MKRVGLHPFPLPLGLDLEKWLRRAKTPWDAFPDTGSGKMDAESCGVNEALLHPNVELRENAKAERLMLEPDGKCLAGVDAVIGGERTRIGAKIVILAAGAVNSAALLLASRDGGIANRSDTVGRHFMNHNCSAVLAIDPRSVNDSVYQKTIGMNDFYLDDGNGGPPLGNIQLLGRVTGPILKSNMRTTPEWASQPDEPALGRLVCDERGSSESGKPGHAGWRTDPTRLEAKQLVRARKPHQGLQGEVARRWLSDRPLEAIRSPHPVASVRHRSHRRGSGDFAARSLLPRVGPPQFVRG